MAQVQRETEPRPENVWRQIASEPDMTTLRAISLIATANRDAYEEDFASVPEHFALNNRQLEATQKSLEAGGFRILRDDTLNPAEKDKHMRLLDRDLEQLRGVRTLNERIQASQTLEQALANQAQRSTVANLPLHPSVLEMLKDALIPAPERSQSPLHSSLAQQVERNLSAPTTDRTIITASEIETKSRVSMGEILNEIYGPQWRGLFISADLAQLTRYVSNRVDQSGDISAQVKDRLIEIAHDPELAQLFVGQDEQGQDLPLPASLGKFVATAKVHAFKHLEQTSTQVETPVHIKKGRKEKITAPRELNSSLIAALTIDANGNFRPGDLEDLRNVEALANGKNNAQKLYGTDLDDDQVRVHTDLSDGVETLIRLSTTRNLKTIAELVKDESLAPILEAAKARYTGIKAPKNLREVLLRIPHGDTINVTDLRIWVQRFAKSTYHDERLPAKELSAYIERVKAEQAGK